MSSERKQILVDWAALSQVVDYLWEDAQAEFNTAAAARDPDAECHIFHRLRILMADMEKAEKQEQEEVIL